MSDVMSEEEKTEAKMLAAGVEVNERQQQSYFGFEERHRYYFPDGVTYIEHQTLNEGARKDYMNSMSREVVVKRHTGDSVMKLATGEEKHKLFEVAIQDWNLIKPDGSPVAFTRASLREFLKTANPRVIDGIEKDIRKHNPWLLQDMTIEDMEQQIKELEEMIEVKKREEEGKE